MFALSNIVYNACIPSVKRTTDNVTCIVLLTIPLRFGAILQMAPKRSVQVTREQLRKTRRRASTAAGASAATNDATGPDGVGPDVDIGASVSTPESMAETRPSCDSLNSLAGCYQ